MATPPLAQPQGFFDIFKQRQRPWLPMGNSGFYLKKY
jgi:hypothetical protein